MNRPSNEITGMVVAKREGWGTAYLMDDGGFMADYWVQGNVAIPDPRDDTDAALELLHWLIGFERFGRYTVDEYYRTELGYMVGFYESSMDNFGDDYREPTRIQIPISGQPFRYAVVNLAAQVMEIKDD